MFWSPAECMSPSSVCPHPVYMYIPASQLVHVTTVCMPPPGVVSYVAPCDIPPCVSPLRVCIPSCVCPSVCMSVSMYVPLCVTSYVRYLVRPPALCRCSKKRCQYIKNGTLRAAENVIQSISPREISGKLGNSQIYYAARNYFPSSFNITPLKL